jgi:hypothetical protein
MSLIRQTGCGVKACVISHFQNSHITGQIRQRNTIRCSQRCFKLKEEHVIKQITYVR